MITNCLVVTVIIMIVLLFVLMDQLSYLTPYRADLYERYAIPIGLFAAAVFVNVFAATYVLNRKFFLKDTGEKLTHLTKQIRTSESPFAEEIRHRFSSRR